MVLGKEAILRYVESGAIQIKPFVKDHLREASVVFSLSSKLLILDVEGSFSQLTMNEHGYVLEPGGFVIGYTNEHLKLDVSVCAIFNTRRAYARLGIDALQTDTFAEPGTDNIIELSIRNGGPSSVTLMPNMSLVKVFFQQVL